ncbi:hypothetical protein INR49_018355 [Caranx melampygus]|nr:hypothetical protein INR49_018355 [Caranx melampygus]
MMHSDCWRRRRRRRVIRCSSTHLSLEGHQLHVQLAKEGVGGGRAAGHGHHVLLGQVSGWTPGVLRVRSLDRVVPVVLVAPVGQLSGLPVHQAGPGPGLLPGVVVLHQTGDGFVR